MARAASTAAYYRAHREAFLLAQELGCTPKEAADELKRRAAREHHHETAQRLAAKIGGAPSHRLVEPAERDAQPWMMRD
jgi:hypothetical protein